MSMGGERAWADRSGPILEEGKGRKILVVDDNVDVATFLAELLRLLNHHVDIAYDGARALELASIHQPEVVLLDLGMPGMDGWKVVRRLERREANSRSCICIGKGLTFLV